MGGNKRYGPQKSIPAWARTLGDLKANGVQVRGICGRCSFYKDADLDRMITAKGAAYSLWDRRTPCPTLGGCSGRVLFMYRLPGGGTPFRPFKTRD